MQNDIPSDAVGPTGITFDRFQTLCENMENRMFMAMREEFREEEQFTDLISILMASFKSAFFKICAHHEMSLDDAETTWKTLSDVGSLMKTFRESQH